MNIRSLFLVLCMLLMAPVLIPSSIVWSAELVDINRADAAAMIANWKGIGEKKAKAIIAYRKKNGPFASVNDLANVKGIGDALIKNNKKYMSVKGGLKTMPASKTKKPPVKSKTQQTKKTKKNASSKAATKKTPTKKPVNKNKDKKKKKAASS